MTMVKFHNGDLYACMGIKSSTERPQKLTAKIKFQLRWSKIKTQALIGGTSRNSSLTITRVGVEDLGSYSCVALNR